MFRWNGVYSESKLLANHQGFFSFNVAIQRSAESRVTNLCFNDGL